MFSCTEARARAHAVNMQAIVNSQTPCWSDGNLTVISPEALINSEHTSYCLVTGQFSLQRPWQRSAAPQTQQQKQPPAGCKRHSDGAPKQPVSPSEHQQQLQKDIEIILQAHRQLLQLCQQGSSGTADAAAHNQGDAGSAGLASANAEAHDQSATASIVPAVSSANKVSIDGDSATDWPAVAALKHVLKPALAFQYIDHQGQQQSFHSKLFNTVISNPSSSEVVATAHDRHVLLPPGCSFCMSDIKGMHPFVQAVQEQGGADMLLVDPPWENASAWRSATYSTLTPRHLLYLPVKDMVRQASSSLVALWVTNRPRLHRFIQQQLLPAWGLRHAATWFWLKVTDAGEPVTPLSSLHRHPFEQLWLLRPVLQQQQQPPAAAAAAGSQVVPLQAALVAACATTPATTQAGAVDPGVQVLPGMAAARQPSAVTAAALQAGAADLGSQDASVMAAVPATAGEVGSQVVETAAAAPVVTISAPEEGTLHQPKGVDTQSEGATVPVVDTRALPIQQAAPLCQLQQQAGAHTTPPTESVCTAVRTAPVGAAQGTSSGGVAAQEAHLLVEDVMDAMPVLQPPDRHVIVSVPGVHSRKPHLRQLLLPYVQEHDGKGPAAVEAASASSCNGPAPTSSNTASQPTGLAGGRQSLQTAKAVAATAAGPDGGSNNKLPAGVVQGSTLVQCKSMGGKQPPLFVELFARQLFPDCMSWGNEVLKFQDLEYWCNVAE